MSFDTEIRKLERDMDDNPFSAQQTKLNSMRTGRKSFCARCGHDRLLSKSLAEGGSHRINRVNCAYYGDNKYAVYDEYKNICLNCNLIFRTAENLIVLTERELYIVEQCLCFHGKYNFIYDIKDMCVLPKSHSLAYGLSSYNSWHVTQDGEPIANQLSEDMSIKELVELGAIERYLSFYPNAGWPPPTHRPEASNEIRCSHLVGTGPNNQCGLAPNHKNHHRNSRGEYA